MRRAWIEIHATFGNTLTKDLRSMFHRQRLIAGIGAVAATCLLTLGVQAAEQDVDELHAVLKSDAPLHEKAVACKRLAVVGTKESVPVLARLLADESLSHYARFGLEAIPDPAVDEAFRKALGELEGPLLIGVINSIGQRRDAKAVAPLSKLLDDSNAQTAAAAAAALGEIADEQSVAALMKRLEKSARPAPEAVADAVLTSARRLVAEDETERAVAIYGAVRRADLPERVRFGAADSEIRARGSAAVPMIRELLQGDDDAFFAVALQGSREVRGEEVTQALIEALDGLSPQRKALLLAAIGDRGDKNALPTLRDAARSDETVVQVAAIRALQKVGDSSVVELLFDQAVSGDEETAAAARHTLEVLPGDDVDEAIVSQLNRDEPERLELLIRLAGRRRIDSAIPVVLKELDSPREALRLAAIEALGEAAGREQLDLLVQKVVTSQSAAEEQAAQSALSAACVRLPDQEAGTKYVVSLFSKAPAEKRVRLFELLRELGGETALASVVAAARDEQDTIQDAATRVLGEWLTVDAAPELLDLAQTLRSNKYKIRALRGYIRIIRQFGLPEDERVAMSRKALQASERDDEKKLVLEALSRFPSVPSLDLAIEQLESPGLKVDAARAAVQIAERLAGSDPEKVRTAMRRVLDARVDDAIANQAETVLKRAKEAAGQ
jgi:HEAT repeat protein